MKRLRGAVFCLLCLLVGCAEDPAACPIAGQSRQLRVTLYFGLARPDGGAVSLSQWRGFVDGEVTPRFPDGFSELEATGQWRDRVSGRIGRLPSRLLVVVASDGPELRDKISALRALYRQRFHQQSVGVETAATCASF